MCSTSCLKQLLAATVTARFVMVIDGENRATPTFMVRAAFGICVSLVTCHGYTMHVGVGTSLDTTVMACRLSPF